MWMGYTQGFDVLQYLQYVRVSGSGAWLSFSKTSEGLLAHYQLERVFYFQLGVECEHKKRGNVLVLQYHNDYGKCDEAICKLRTLSNNIQLTAPFITDLSSASIYLNNFFFFVNKLHVYIDIQAFIMASFVCLAKILEFYR